MKSQYFIFLVTLILQLSKISVSSNIRMQNDNDCKYALSDGSLVNFSHLRRTQDYVFQLSRYSYKANFCGPLVDQCPGSLAPAAIFIKETICFNHLSSSWTQTKLEYLDNSNPSKGVKLQFPPGDKCYFDSGQFNLNYIIECDQNTEMNFQTIMKLQACNYEYHFKSKYGCQNSFIKGNIINSTMILFIFVVLFSLYCIGFSFFNYRNNPEDGLMKAFPHREFWRTFFDNAIHGVKVIPRLVKAKLKVNDNNSYNY